ncbi:NAD(P)-binding protein [Roseobacteraceae bacterium NS-SX3]
MDSTRRKIAILGGGVGAMTAAFQLTADEASRARYDITVYQVGWRLGGKGASGRHPGTGARIEEHGLHVWSGFYDNAIRQMKACLDELRGAGADGVFASFEDAFLPHNNIALGDGAGTGWSFWPVRPENNDAVPGTGGVLLSPWDYFTELARYLRDMHERSPLQARAADHPAARLPGDVMLHLGTRDLPSQRRGNVTALHVLDDFAHDLPRGRAQHDPRDIRALTALTREAHDTVKRHRAELTEDRALEPELRRMLQALDLGGAALRGMIADGVIQHGFDVIDDQEISQWLARHGARPGTIDSPLVRAVYDYAFGFRHGITSPAHRAIAAGTFLRGSMRLFLTYKGSIFFKMRAGMGDTIFTPYYKVLKRRGVKFEFFHKVRELKLDPSARFVERIGIDRQATVTNGDYDPFVRVGELDCWPSAPRYDQLTEGDELKTRGIDLESSWSDWQPPGQVTLQRGTDFDDVVLGISIGALPAIAGELIRSSPAWQNMVDRVETAATQAMQLWLKPDVEALGWPNGDSILTAYADPMNTWADMTHLDPAETWPANETPGSIAYFCGPLADPDPLPPFTDTGFPARAVAAVRDSSRAWLDTHLADIWPDTAAAGGGFDTDLLIAPDPGQGGDLWETQYFRANFEPTDRYVLSVPGSTDARLRADRSGFKNLWLAGDWTYTGINAGCVEAAAMSGLRAAAGLMGVVPDIAGEEADPVPGGPHKGAAPNPPMGPVLNTLRAQNSEWPWSSLYGMAQTIGPAVMIPFPADTVAKMLPQGLILAPQSLAPGGQHPVILLFAQQRGVRPNQLPFGMSYTEFICAVPWVQHADERLQDLPPLITPTKLYLDSLPPILLGIYGYGFPKERAAMEVDEDTYIVRDARNGSEIISCSFSRTGPQVQTHMLPHFAAARPGYEMAMVCRNRLGQWQYSAYDFSLGQALLEPLDMEIRISADRFGLPPGILTPPSITNSPFGAVFLTSDATINNPLQSYQLRRVLRERAR